MGVTDCLNFGNPERPEIMWQFARAVEGIAEGCRAFETPVTGGNVSFYNETSGQGVFPTPTIAMVGLIEDLKHVTTQWFAKEGDRIVLLGENKGHIGGSEYLRYIHNLEKGRPPALDLDLEVRVQQVCREAAGLGLLTSAHDCSEGGIAVALAECCITGPQRMGAGVSLETGLRPDTLLFGECQSRIVLSLPEGNLERLQALATKLNVPCSEIGKVGGRELSIHAGGASVIDVQVEEAHAAWKGALSPIIGE
jgi:phosphoribosylformylglycinamidine synthase